jgi:DNA-binding PadR family transcriptional regulator
MALSHSILATLVGRGKSLSGYDLAKEFNSSVGFTGKPLISRSTESLQDLKKKELLHQRSSSKRIDQTKKYTYHRKWYEDLVEWIAEPSMPTPIKEDMLVKMYVVFLVPKEILKKELEQLKKLHEEKLNLFRNMKNKFFLI